MHQTDGPLTGRLAKAPDSYRGGLVPVDRRADHITTAVCGFCSTGCNLEIRHRGGAPVGLHPETSYPVNRGRACPKGWEALTPLSSPDRATTPLVRDTTGQLAPTD